MYDVVFITPNMKGDMAGEVLGTLILATILKEKGVSCDILRYYNIGDLQDFEGFLDNAIRILEEKKPKIVSFYARCDTYHIHLRLAQRIKERWNDVYIVFAGPQSDLTAEKTIRQIPWVDYVCCGEGETTIYPLFSSLLQGKPNHSVDGLVYRDGDEVKKNPRPELIPNLDDLPMIDYSFFEYLKEKEIGKTKGFPVDVGRGCPFGCSYCSTKTFWGRKFRIKSPQRIIAEIKDLHERFGVTQFGFSHDMFTMNRAKVLETCALLKELDFPIKWSCSARLDCVDPELIDVMVDAGMDRIIYGVETGSPRMQNLIHKNLKLDRAVELLEYSRQKGVDTTASFMYGFPEETEEDLSATIGLIGQFIGAKNISTQIYFCAFLPGTELAERYISEMTPVEFFSDFTREYAIEECKDLIQAHPDLFQHMMEYKTELRSKLEYFKLFMNTWGYLRPVYVYLSKKYPANRLIDMYYDFVRQNKETLEQMDENDPHLISGWITPRDRLPELFADDPNYDIIKDIYRYKTIERSETVRCGGMVTDVFCFNPADLNKKPLEEMERCMAMVTWDQHKRSVACYPAM